MNQMMKAVVLHGPGEYAVEKVRIPEPGYGEVLVEIRSISICGSDPGIFAGAVRKDGWPPGLSPSVWLPAPALKIVWSFSYFLPPGF